MKRLFNIFIIILLASSSIAFAKSGVEIGIFVPLGVGVGINQYTLTNNNPTTEQQKDFEAAVKQSDKKSAAGFDSGLSFQIGYRFQISKDMSFSLLGELGYAHDEFAFYRNSSDKNYKSTLTYSFENIVIGIYPKLNWQKFSFGLNLGLKVPLYTRVISYYTDYNKKTITGNIEHYDAFQIKNLFNVPVIPYLRFSVDYSLYTDKRFEFVLGGYIGGDFGMSLKKSDINDQTIGNKNIAALTKQTVSSFDIGFEVGIKILPNN